MDKLDKFIKQHKPYFERNKEYLISNTWHLNKTEADEIKTNRERDRLVSRIVAKEKSVKADETLVANICNRLSAFIKKADADRHLKKVKEFIDYSSEIILLFIQKCNAYIDLNNITEIEDAEVREAEISLQDTVFNTMIKLQDKLDDMNVNSEVDNIEIKLYGKDTFASLVMKEPLSLTIPDVRRKVEEIGISWSIMNSNEMYRNMNLKDIPQWNEKKHFWDQEQTVLQFWVEEYNKIRNGITIGGYFIHPWVYFHLNFYKTPIPQPDGTEPIINPYFRDNEWFFAEMLKKAEEAKDKGILLYGSRRIAKSVILSSYIHWKAITKFNSVATVTGGSDGDLADLTDKIKTSMNYIEKPFHLYMINQDWDNGHTTLGVRKDASTPIKFSTIAVKNLAQGAKKSTQKTAGGAPSAFVNDEIGKYDFLKSYLAAIPSFETPHGFKCVPLMAGTGGEADLSADAMKVLKSPSTYHMLPMDYDLLEETIDPEYITWKRSSFATFFPGQMSYHTPKIEKKLSEFLRIKNKELDKLTIQQTDWKNSLIKLQKTLEEKLKEKGVNRTLLEQQHKVQYPLDPQDCFLSTLKNPFLPLEVRKHKEKLIETGDTGKKVRLRKENGKVVYDLAPEVELAEYPFTGGFHDAPVVIYIEPPLHNEMQDYEFVAGLDDYKHEEGNGDSVGSFTIYRRNCFDERGNMMIAATYDSRPYPHSKFHKQGLLLLELYNAECFPENEDMDFKLFLDNQRLTYRYLVKGINLAQDLDLNTAGGRREFGWTPTEKNIAFGYGLVKKYVTESIEIKDEEGVVVSSKFGFERIKSIGILEELENYKPDQNFDRLRSFMSALMYDHYLTSQYIIPKAYESPEDKRKKELERFLKKKNKKGGSNLFSKSPGNPFSK